MNELLKIMDEQMLAWVAELNELYKSKESTDKAIKDLEERIQTARKTRGFLVQKQ